MDERSLKEILKQYFVSGTKSLLPHVSINAVVVAYDHPRLLVLAHRLPGQKLWMLPGGYVKKKENLDDAAYRNLKLSGIDHVFLRQIMTFGDARRVTGIHLMKQGRVAGYNRILKWASGRFVTVVYYGLVSFSKTKLINGGITAESKWLDMNGKERLAMDHAQIISETRKILASEMLNHPVALSLMPTSFTLNDLRGLYEAVLNRTIDRGTFRRKILSQGIIEKVGNQIDGAGRPSDVYRFDKEAYLRSLGEETKFGF